MRKCMQSAHGLAALLLGLSLATIGCGSATAPSSKPAFDLTGVWSYSFVAVHPAACHDSALQQGCGGGGDLQLVQSGNELSGSSMGGGGCQTCGMAWDYGGGELRDGKVSITTLEFTILNTRFSAVLPPQEVEEITGTVSSALGPGLEAQGVWRMTRSQ